MRTMGDEWHMEEMNRRWKEENLSTKGNQSVDEQISHASPLLFTWGYHSESGWQTLLEIIIEHYGLEIDQSAVTIFICLIPVIIDACVKLWVVPKGGKYFPGNEEALERIFMISGFCGHDQTNSVAITRQS
ncbi:unnamed protein product [Camellia sinensis]